MTAEHTATRPGSAGEWPGILGRLLAGDDLTQTTAADVARRIMLGEATDAQIAGLLVALRAKGETVEEITGLVHAMRAAALPLELPGDEVVVDTCGTGGDRAGTFNVSTLAAIVTAAAGVRVAKHGNRAASSRCGSADLLEAEGVVIDLPPAAVARCVDEVGIGFCFAPLFHPAMRFVMPARRQLGVPTVFNVLGPMANPAGVRRQTVGVADPAIAARMAEVFSRLGADHVMVFHGADGLDELSTTGPSTVYDVRQGRVEPRTFDPADVGLPRARLHDLVGGDVDANRRIADRVLAGGSGPQRDIVLLGAAAALLVAGRAREWADGLHQAASAVDGGAAGELLARWADRSQALAASSDDPSGVR